MSTSEVGRQRRQSGLTLVELLIVTAILGILAMILARFFGDATTGAVEASLEGQIRGIVVAQETHLAINGTYTSLAEELDFSVGGNVGVELSVGDGNQYSQEGWSARLRHEPTGVECAVYHGDVADHAFEPAEEEKVVACRKS